MTTRLTARPPAAKSDTRCGPCVAPGPVNNEAVPHPCPHSDMKVAVPFLDHGAPRDWMHSKDEKHSYTFRNIGRFFVCQYSLFSHQAHDYCRQNGSQKPILAYIVDNPTKETARSDFERRVADAIATAQPIHTVVTKIRPEPSKKSHMAISPHDFKMCWVVIRRSRCFFPC